MGSIPSPVMARLEQNWSRAVHRRFSHILNTDLSTLSRSPAAISGRCSTDKPELSDQGQRAPLEGTNTPKPLQSYIPLQGKHNW